MKDPGVYIIKNTKNGRVYVGSSMNSCRARFHHHMLLLRKGRHKSVPLSLDFAAHGKESFEFSLICECSDPDRLCAMELQVVKQYHATDPEKGYNLQRPFDIRRNHHGRPKLPVPNVRFSKMVPPGLAAKLREILAMDVSSIGEFERQLKGSIPARGGWHSADKARELVARIAELEAKLAVQSGLDPQVPALLNNVAELEAKVADLKDRLERCARATDGQKGAYWKAKYDELVSKRAPVSEYDQSQS